MDKELSETCRVFFSKNKLEKLVHLVGFIIRNWTKITMTSVNQRSCTLRCPVHILHLHISTGRGTQKKGRGSRTEIDDVKGDIEIK